jgi:DNA invertase Pin-like site-specific DNA recombinase
MKEFEEKDVWTDFDVVTEPGELRYAIYCRKSSEPAEKQAQSLETQLKACRKEAKGLAVVAEITESHTARKPRKRKLFKRLLNEITTGHIQGIISYHPDRLSRNPLESARIVYMLDQGQIKDLKFSTYFFSNDPAGILLLGVLFNIADHFSRDLSVKVKGGLDTGFTHGRSSGATKWGYIREENGSYVKDEPNFSIFQKAWHLRAGNMSLDAVADWMNVQDFKVFVKNGEETKMGWEKRTINKARLSKKFEDTFYFGILNQVGGSYDMRIPNSTFEPMISDEVFVKVSELGRRNARGTGKKLEKFMPLRYRVFCAVCNNEKPMIVAPKPKNAIRDAKSMFYFRCDNLSCTRKPKSMDEQVIWRDVLKIVGDNFSHMPAEAYDQYLDEVKSYTVPHRINVRTELAALKTINSSKRKELSSLSISLARAGNDAALRQVNQDMAELSSEIDRNKLKISKLNDDIEKMDIPVLPKAEFDELIGLAVHKIEVGDRFQREQIIKEIFLKLYIDNEKVVSYLWQEPLDTLFKYAKVRLGADERT